MDTLYKIEKTLDFVQGEFLENFDETDMLSIVFGTLQDIDTNESWVKYEGQDENRGGNKVTLYRADVYFTHAIAWEELDKRTYKYDLGIRVIPLYEESEENKLACLIEFEHPCGLKFRL